MRLSLLYLFLGIVTGIPLFFPLQRRVPPRILSTNAARFAAGLPPLAPRSLYQGSKVCLASRAVPSGTPGATVVGTINLVNPSTGATIGCVNGYGTYSPACINPMAFQYTEPANYAGTPLSVRQYGALTTTYFCLGSVLAQTLRSSSGNSVNAVASIGLVSAATGPVMQGTSYVECTLFSIDPATGNMAETWTNSDKTSVPIQTVALSNTNSFVFTGNQQAYNTQNGATGVLVTLQFQPR